MAQDKRKQLEAILGELGKRGVDVRDQLGADELGRLDSIMGSDTTQPAKELTPNDIGGLYAGESADDKAIREAEERAFQLTQVEEPDRMKTREEYLTDFQEEIDALTEAATREKARITSLLGEKAERQLGSQRALLAGAGMLGQVSGQAMKGELEDYQAKELSTAISAVDSALQQSLAQVRREAKTLADQDYEAKKRAYAEGASTLVDYLRTKKERKAENIGRIVDTALLREIDLADKSNIESVNELALSLGVNPNDIIDAYTESKQIQDAQYAQLQREIAKEESEMAKREAETNKLIAEEWRIKNPDDHLIVVDGGIYNATKGMWIRSPKVPTDEYVVVDGEIFNKTKGVWAKTGSLDAPDKLDDEGLPEGYAENVEALEEKVGLIDELLIDKAITNCVGPTSASRIGTGTFTGANARFIAGVEKLISQETIDTLISLKERGGTLGALSDQERLMLESAASKIGTWRIRDKNGMVIGYKARVNDFKKELERLKKITQNQLGRLMEQGPVQDKVDDVDYFNFLEIINK